MKKAVTCSAKKKIIHRSRHRKNSTAKTMARTMATKGRSQGAHVSACLLLLVSCVPALALDPATGLAQYRRQTWRAENGLSFETVHGITQTPDGYIWLAVDGPLLRFDGLNFSTETTKDNLQVRALLEEKTAVRIEREGLPGFITATCQDRQGVIWVGTDNGLVRIRNNKVEKFPASDPLAGSIILSLFEDREGDLWIGTESDGLTVLRDEKFRTYTALDGLSQDTVQCVLQDRSGVIWAGTKNGLSRFENGRFSNLTTKDGLPSDVILSLSLNPTGGILVGTPDGLSVVRGNTVQTLTSADGLPDDFVRSIYAAVDGSIWIGTRHGLAHRLANGTIRTYTEADGLASDVVGAIAQSPEGVIWVGTLHGLSKSNGSSFQKLLPDTVTAVYPDKNGNVWAGTSDGIIDLNKNGTCRYPAGLGLPIGIYGITEDDQHYLWLTAKTGIFRVEKSSLIDFANGTSRRIDLISYGSSAGLRAAGTGEGHPGIWKASDGFVWLATRRGLSVVSPAKLSSGVPPVAQIESISVDGRPTDSASLPAGSNRLAFTYTGLNFAAPYEVMFRYKLDGFDRDWIDAGTRRVAYYTNLSPGEYRFHVLARSADGIWSRSDASVSLRLRPHFYQTYWFDILLLFAIAALAYEIYWLRVKHVQQRFDAVLAERNRIAREIHDTLAQAFVAVSVQLEVLARTLATSPAEAIRVLDDARALVRDGIAEARRAIWDLRSQVPNDDLAARISKMALRVTASSQVKVKLNVGGTYRPLASNVESELLRIGQEALTNVVRHADARHVSIDLKFDPNRFRMTIEDDGHGFSTDARSLVPNGHFGIQGMKERAAQIDADFEMTSAPGQGTKVCVEKVIR